MTRYEVVNEILEYLDTRRSELLYEKKSSEYLSPEYSIEIDAMFEVYDHLIAKFEDDYR